MSKREKKERVIKKKEREFVRGGQRESKFRRRKLFRETKRERKREREREVSLELEVCYRF